MGGKCIENRKENICGWGRDRGPGVRGIAVLCNVCKKEKEKLTGGKM